MRKPRQSGWLVLVCALLSAACASETKPEVTLGQDDSALASYRFGEPLYVQDSGHFGRYVYHGWTSESFWIDLDVRNDSPRKEVGVVWTKDGWQSSSTTRASFEASLGSGRERWGVDVSDFAGSYGGQGVEVEYAAYVAMNGKTYWSALRNHYIYQVVTPQKPVRLLRSEVSLDAGHPVLKGSARALNVPSARRVFVRYTVDDWKSFAEAEASYDGKDFSFEIALTCVPALTEAVAFALRFEAEGEAHWDNNAGQNYRHQLAPMLSQQTLEPMDVAAAGFRALSAYVSTGLPVSAVSLRIDGGEAIALTEDGTSGYTLQGFERFGSIRYTFPVSTLANGVHTLTLEVTAGPFVRSYAPLSFEVDDAITAPASLPLDASDGIAWDVELADDGHLYVARDRSVAEYDALDGAAASVVFESPVSSYLREVTVDDAGRVYALANSSELVRWLPSGELDASFGTGGVLQLGGNYGGEPLCYAVDVQALPSGLYLLDSCNPRLLQLTFEGSFASVLDLEALGYDFAQELRRDGASLWLEAVSYDAGKSELLGVDTSDDGAAHIAETIALPSQSSSIESFAISASFVWTSDYAGMLHLYTRAGERVGSWFGGYGTLAEPGSTGSFAALEAIDDGVVLALDRNAMELEVLAAAAR